MQVESTENTLDAVKKQLKRAQEEADAYKNEVSGASNATAPERKK